MPQYRHNYQHSSRYLAATLLLAVCWSTITITSSPIVLALAMTAGPQRTVLVTGGAGYIGSHTCLELLKIPNQQYKVVVVDNLDNSSEESLKRVRELLVEGEDSDSDDDYKDRIQFRNCDVRDKEGLDKGEWRERVQNERSFYCLLVIINCHSLTHSLTYSFTHAIQY